MKNPKSILLVEDDKDDQEFFLLALKSIENVTLYDVANNGKEALAKLQHADVFPDLIFSDINMPLMNGMEYLSAMTSNPRTSNIPIIMLTTDIRKVDLAMKLGAKACIQKPTDEMSLLNQLRQVIGADLKKISA